MFVVLKIRSSLKPITTRGWSNSVVRNSPRAFPQCTTPPLMDPSMASGALCHHCSGVFMLDYGANLTYLTYEGDDSYPDLPNFAATSLAGCSACGLLRSRVYRTLEQLKIQTNPNSAQWDKKVSFKRIIVVFGNDVVNDKVPESENGPC